MPTPARKNDRPNLQRFEAWSEYGSSLISGDSARQERALKALLEEARRDGNPREVVSVLSDLVCHYCRVDEPELAEAALWELEAEREPQEPGYPINGMLVEKLWEGTHEIGRVERVVGEALNRRGWDRTLGLRSATALQLKCLQLKMQALRGAPAEELDETFVDIVSLPGRLRAWDPELFQALRELHQKGLLPPPARVILGKLKRALEAQILARGEGDSATVAELGEMMNQLSTRRPKA